MITTLKTTDMFRADTEEEAVQKINDTRDAALIKGYTLTKSSYVNKTKKSKGEIIDSWYIVTVEKTFND